MPLALQWWGSQGLWIPDNLLYSHIIAGAEKVCVICSIQIFQLHLWVFRSWRLVLLCCVTGAYLGVYLFPFETGRPTILQLPGNREGVNTDVCLWVRRGESSFLWLWRQIPLASEWEGGQLLPVQSTGYNRFPASALKVTLGLPNPQSVLAIWCWDFRTIPSPPLSSPGQSLIVSGSSGKRVTHHSSHSPIAKRNSEWLTEEEPLTGSLKMTRETDFSLTVTALCPQPSSQLVARPARRRGKGPLCLGLGEVGVGSKCVMSVEGRENHHIIVALESHGRQRHKSHVEASHLGWPVFASKHLLAGEIQLPDPHTLSYCLQSGLLAFTFT